ncbi:MAG: DUF4840 domain-containing protein [Prevotella sp.]
MRKFINPAKMFVTLMVLGCTMGFTSCSDDDDDDKTPPTEITASIMYGDYEGKMTTVAAEGQDGEEAPASVDVKATIDNDSVFFDSFPVKDIIVSVVGDETAAEAIMQAVGNVSYKIGYTPTIMPNKDIINIALDAEPLKLEVVMPSEEEGAEPAKLVVEVEVEASETGAYKVEDGNLTFAITAKKVFLGEGEGKMELPGFTPTQFNLNLNQYKVGHHQF